MQTKFGEDLLEGHASLSAAQVVPMARRRCSMSEKRADDEDARGLATLLVASDDEVKSWLGPYARLGSASSWQ